MKLKKIIPVFLLVSVLVSSCSTTQLPAKTESVKTDNNKKDVSSTNTTSKVEFEKKILTLTYKQDGVENPLVPEIIDYIEIFDKERIFIKPSDIGLLNNDFSIKAEKINAKDKVTFDGKGKFSFKNISDKAVVNFKIKGVREVAKVPVINQNLRVLIEESKDYKLTVSGGVPKSDGLLDTTKEVFSVSKDDLGKSTLKIRKSGLKNTFKVDDLQKNSKTEDENKPDKSEKDDENERKKIEENIVKVTPIAGFIGDWDFSLFNQAGTLSLREFGQGKNDISGELKLETKTYTGKATYKGNEENTVISFLTTAIEPATGYTSVIGLKLEVKGSNKLDVKLERISEPFESLSGILLHLTRKIPIPETTTPQPTPTPSTPVDTSKPIDKTKFLPIISIDLVKELAMRVNYIAGNSYAHGQDNGVGNVSTFFDPTGIAVDNSGNIFISDTGNHSIRKITPDGNVSTFAGSTRYYDWWYSDGSNAGFSDGNTTSAKFSYPKGIAVDNSGNVFVADTGNNRIRKITPDGNVSTFTGKDAGFSDGNAQNAKFSHPNGMTIDRNGNLFVIDEGNSKIRKITPSGVVSTVNGSSGAFYTDNDNNFHYIRGITVDSFGNLFITDLKNSTIKKITPDGNISNVYSGDVYSAIAIDPTSGNLFISGYGRIKKITPNGVITAFTGNGNSSLSGTWGTGSSIKLNDAIFGTFEGMYIDNSGTIFIAETDKQIIRKIK